MTRADPTLPYDSRNVGICRSGRRLWPALVPHLVAIAIGAAYINAGWMRNLGPLPYEGPEWFFVPFAVLGGLGAVVWSLRRNREARRPARLRSAALTLLTWAVLLVLPYAVRRAMLEYEVRSLPIAPIVSDVARRVDVVRFDRVPHLRVRCHSSAPYSTVERTLQEGLAGDGWTLLNPPKPPFVGPRRPIVLLGGAIIWGSRIIESGRNHRYVFARGRERLIVKLDERADGTRIESAKEDRQPGWLARLRWRFR